MYEWKADSGVDLDLLADYVGGALDGTPDAATVEQRIADDPAWMQAYAELTAAIEAVRVDLSTLGTTGEEQMPADVARRVDAALAAVPESRDGAVVQFVPWRRRLRQRPAASGRDWSRRLRPVAVAAAVLVCVGIGGALLSQELTGPQAENATSMLDNEAEAPVSAMGEQQPSKAPDQRSAAAGKAPRAATGDGVTAGPLEASDAAPQILTTGTDYDRERLGQQVATMLATRGSAGTPPADQRQESGASTAVPAPLQRLADAGTLSGCLASIRTEHAQPAATVRLVDLARYEGSPAMIVLLADPAGTQWIWVVGPECGTAGADTWYSARAG